MTSQASVALRAVDMPGQGRRVAEPRFKHRRGTDPGLARVQRERIVSTGTVKQGKDRHQEILDAAARVITERGLAETRISDIAEEAGVSPGLILYYFDSKDRLLAEALTFANDQFYLRTSREIRRIPSAIDQLRRLVDLSVPGYLPEYGRLDEWALWIEVWVRALRDRDMAKDREVLDDRWRSQIADVIRAGKDSGEFTTTDDTDELAIRIGCLIDGLAIQVVMNDSTITTTRMHDAVMRVSSQLLGF